MYMHSLTGTTVGAVLTFTTSGLLCAYGFDNGWPSIFYIHGKIKVRTQLLLVTVHLQRAV